MSICVSFDLTLSFKNYSISLAGFKFCVAISKLQIILARGWQIIIVFGSPDDFPGYWTT